MNKFANVLEPPTSFDAIIRCQATFDAIVCCQAGLEGIMYGLRTLYKFGTRYKFGVTAPLPRQRCLGTQQAAGLRREETWSITSSSMSLFMKPTSGSQSQSSFTPNSFVQNIPIEIGIPPISSPQRLVVGVISAMVMAEITPTMSLVLQIPETENPTCYVP